MDDKQKGPPFIPCRVVYWQILLQKSVAADGLSAIWLVSTGFDPPTLAALRNFDATLRAAPSLSRRRSCD
jgi:hypothetical protein